MMERAAQEAHPGRDAADRLETCSACGRPVGGLPHCAPGDDWHTRPLCAGCFKDATAAERARADEEARRIAHVGPRLVQECEQLVRQFDADPSRLEPFVEAVRQIVSEARAA